jgi:uncharacterized protein
MAPIDTSPGETGLRRGPGGTAGGMGEFLLGLALLVAGGYLFLDSVTVTSNLGALWGWGYGSFGLSLIPLFLGVALLFFNGRSVPGWVLTGAGVIIIFVGVLARMTIYIRHTSLFNVILILVLIAAGVGLIARGLRAH